MCLHTLTCGAALTRSRKNSSRACGGSRVALGQGAEPGSCLKGGSLAGCGVSLDFGVLLSGFLTWEGGERFLRPWVGERCPPGGTRHTAVPLPCLIKRLRRLAPSDPGGTAGARLTGRS